VKTAKDLIIPFTWEKRHPILLDRFFYVPGKFEHCQKNFSFFEKEQPIMIEYCSGNGQWIGERAKQNPHLNWIAVEKKFERARTIWLKMHRENIPNLFPVCAEGLTFTKFYAPKAQEIFINFPDPWPKLRHGKHRIVRKEFVDELYKILEPGGKATCVTDDENYARQMRREFEKAGQWKLLFDVTELPDYGRSFFNDLWQRAGKTIYYLNFERL
jgi:tRNA (guanine-N7-)-methyltransferase